MAVRAIRGATQVDADDREQVLEATRELVDRGAWSATSSTSDDLISILFTATPDLVSRSSPPWPPASSGWATCR